LAKLPEAQISPISTLYLAPQTQAPLDDEMLERLGIDLQMPKASSRANPR